MRKFWTLFRLSRQKREKSEKGRNEHRIYQDEFSHNKLRKKTVYRTKTVSVLFALFILN